jgi:hypothetical protein
VILLWGLRGEGPMEEVQRALARQGCHIRFLDQRTAPGADADIHAGFGLTGSVDNGHGLIDLAEVTAAYVRPYDARELPIVRRAGSGSELWARSVQLTDMLLSWADLSPALVVNRPSAMALNSSKPLQAAELRVWGFAVPDTLVTTDPEAVMEFRRRHRRVVYKSVSGVRSIVAEFNDEHLKRLDDVRWCPTQFQALVPGTDRRVHVVGDEVFTTEIRSDTIDYRYSARQGGAVTMTTGSLPDDVAQRCVDMTRGMDLSFSGVDLRCTPEGEWFCFEVNPSPGFTYYQEVTGQPIAEAVARLLAAGPEPAERVVRPSRKPASAGVV